MNESILDSIKNLLGIDKELTAFDQDIVFGINSAFFTLYQIGVGDKPYSIKSSVDVWGDLLQDYDEILSLIKEYTYMKVRSSFDPPTTSFVLDSLNRQIAELEWRIQIQVEVFNDLEDCSKKRKKHKRKPSKDCKEESIPNSVIIDLWKEEE